MNPHLIKRLFPNASASLLAANESDYGAASVIESSGKTPIVERVVGDAALGESKKKGRDTARFLVRVTSVRKRLLDVDNLCEKYHVDCCRYAGTLPNDNPEQTEIQTSQRKASKGEEEHTLVEIFTFPASI